MRRQGQDCRKSRGVRARSWTRSWWLAVTMQWRKVSWWWCIDDALLAPRSGPKIRNHSLFCAFVLLHFSRLAGGSISNIPSLNSSLSLGQTWSNYAVMSTNFVVTILKYYCSPPWSMQNIFIQAGFERGCSNNLKSSFSRSQEYSRKSVKCRTTQETPSYTTTRGLHLFIPLPTIVLFIFIFNKT